MGVDFKKTSHILFFAGFLPVTSLGLGWVNAQLFATAPFWVETLSPLAAYGLLFGLFDKFVWRWPVFRWLGIITVPDARGRWQGEQISSFRDASGKNVKSHVILEISQTFSRIQAQSYYQRWHSTHTVADFIPFDGVSTLVIMFETEPKVTYHGNSKAHKGVVKLTQLPNKQLTGTYFNGLGRHGELTFTRTGYALQHTFDLHNKVDLHGPSYS